MRIVLDYASVAVVVPMVAHLVLNLFGSCCRHYKDGILVHKHHHRPRAECIGAGPLPALVGVLERFSHSEFVPDNLGALQLHRNWKAAHLLERLPDLFYPTTSTDTEADVSHPPHSRNFADWIVIPFQILAGSYLLPGYDILYL